jgi:deoxyribonuclease-1-like protein
LLSFGGVYLFFNYEIKHNGAGWNIAPKNPSGDVPGDQATGPVPQTIRIASFHLGRFDETKLANRRVSDVLNRLLPRFEIIALQGIRGRNQGVLVRLAEQVGAAAGRKYDFATCPTQQRDALEHYSAFLFDATRIDVDRTTVRFVDDRSGQLRIKPLVGAFRVHGPPPEEAFTFTLINVEADADRTAVELDLLAKAYRAVRDDGRGEDDIILLGDLESDDRHLGPLNNLLGVVALLSSVPTSTRGGQLLDNILLDRLATREFNGRVEVVDLMREFELTMPGALEISEHLPIWAEFNSYEIIGQPNRVGANGGL